MWARRTSGCPKARHPYTGQVTKEVTPEPLTARLIQSVGEPLMPLKLTTTLSSITYCGLSVETKTWAATSGGSVSARHTTTASRINAPRRAALGLRIVDIVRSLSS